MRYQKRLPLVTQATLNADIVNVVCRRCYNAVMPSERDKREKVISIIAEQLGVPREQIAKRMPDLDGISIDSLDTVELAMELAEEFDDDWKHP